MWFSRKILHYKNMMAPPKTNSNKIWEPKVEHVNGGILEKNETKIFQENKNIV